MEFLKIIEIMVRHSDVWPMLSPSADHIMFVHGSSDALEAIIQDIEEEFDVNLSIGHDGEFDICQVGEMKVRQFINYVYAKINQSKELAL